MVTLIDDIKAVCYEHSATAFCLLGIRRKAEDHALMAALKQRVIDSETRNLNQIKLRHLTYLLRSFVGHECFLHPIRLLIVVKLLTTPADKIESEPIDTKDFSLDKEEFDLQNDQCSWGRAASIHQLLSKCKMALIRESF